MNDEQSTSASPHPPESTQHVPKSPTISQVIETLNRSTEITGSRRQLVDAALVGTGVVYLFTLLALPRIDTALSVALFAFVTRRPSRAITTP